MIDVYMLCMLCRIIIETTCIVCVIILCFRAHRPGMFHRLSALETRTSIEPENGSSCRREHTQSKWISISLNVDISRKSYRVPSGNEAVEICYPFILRIYYCNITDLD